MFEIRYNMKRNIIIGGTKMINVKSPNPIFLENEEATSAVLLLHSFTGTVRDVKLLANKLHKAGYTCLVPPYRGHGLLLPELMSYDTDDWWEDVQAAYQQLRDKGYQHIHVMGVSLGGLYSLKLAEHFDVTSLVVMSTPHKKEDAGLQGRLKHYGQRMGDLIGLDEETIQAHLAQIEDYDESLELFQAMVNDIMAHLDRIQAPIAIKYGEQDEAAYEQSANYIYEHITHAQKEIQSYSNAGHLMTQGKDHQAVEQDIIEFLSRIEAEL